ncbi:hypothetical protein ACOSQ2_009282 [Xanthoceras sorbifolium]
MFKRKQNVVARSSTEVEYRALSQASTEVLWLSSLFKELGIGLTGVLMLWCDNTNACSLAHNPGFHFRTKHVEVDMHFICEKVVNGQLIIQYIPTESQTANLLTKALPHTRFEFPYSKLNLIVSPQFSLRGHVKALISTSAKVANACICWC